MRAISHHIMSLVINSLRQTHTHTHTYTHKHTQTHTNIRSNDQYKINLKKSCLPGLKKS